MKYFSQALHKLRDRFPSLSRFPDRAKEMKANHWKLVADHYTGALFKSAGDAKIITDKLLTNYFFVGMLHILFPNAKFINTRRDPVDSASRRLRNCSRTTCRTATTWANWGGITGSTMRSMKHWEKVLPKGVMQIVEYENVVADTEKEARAINEFLGLKWDKKMLDFQSRNAR